ncbi:MAG TPA: hypothetical protein VFB07_13050 [Vicinamibacterales bacterium]|nr:hypothetical protein [Vicinamibacterales bacterium]
MSFKPWSLAILWLVAFALFALAGFAVVGGAPLALMVGVALVTPVLVLRDSTRVPSSSHDPWQVRRAGGAMLAPATA